jgi:hypothetical protein
MPAESFALSTSGQAASKLALRARLRERRRLRGQAEMGQDRDDRIERRYAASPSALRRRSQ